MHATMDFPLVFGKCTGQRRSLMIGEIGQQEAGDRIVPRAPVRMLNEDEIFEGRGAAYGFVEAKEIRPVDGTIHLRSCVKLDIHHMVHSLSLPAGLVHHADRKIWLTVSH